MARVPPALALAVGMNACAHAGSGDVSTTTPAAIAVPSLGHDGAVALEPLAIHGAARAPAGFRLDGAVEEWSELSGSSLAVGFLPDGMVLAGRMRSRPGAGLWMSVDTGTPAMPAPGLGDEGVTEEDCVSDPLAEYQECRSLLARRQKMQDELGRRFRADYWLRADTVELKHGGDRCAPVAGARVTWKVEPKGASFEALLPLGALPWFATAPVAKLSLAVAPAAEACRSGEASPVSVAFAPPVVLGDFDLPLLARVLGMKAGPMPSLVAYQPARANLITIIGNDPDTHGLLLKTSERPLWKPAKTLGPLEVGLIEVDDTFLVVRMNGKATAFERLDGDPIGVVERGKGLHVLGYLEGTVLETGGKAGRLEVVEIARDGTVNTRGLQDLPNVFQDDWLSVRQDSGPDNSTFTLEGTIADVPGKQRSCKRVWTYDAQSNWYRLKESLGKVEPMPPGDAE